MQIMLLPWHTSTKHTLTGAQTDLNHAQPSSFSHSPQASPSSNMGKLASIDTPASAQGQRVSNHSGGTILTDRLPGPEEEGKVARAATRAADTQRSVQRAAQSCLTNLL